MSELTQDQKFFQRLNRLFLSTAVIKKKGSKKIIVKDLDLKQSFKTNIRSNNLHSGMYINQAQSSALNVFRPSTMMDRMARYTDYELMDLDGLASSVLDIYSEESLTDNEDGDLLRISSDDEDKVELLHNLFYDILNIDFNLHTWVRNMVKYGDFFLLLEVSPDYGVVNVIPFTVYEMERIEEQLANGNTNTFFTLNGSKQEKFEAFEIAHFRLLTDIAFLPYGRSILEQSRKIWKNLRMMEDAMLIYRITRAPERRMFFIDIGNLNPNDVDQYMEKVIAKMKKAPMVNSLTGEIDFSYNLDNITEDIFFPTRGANESTRVETLPGSSNTDAIEDIEYLQNKLFAAWKVPKSFLGYEEEIGAKSTLAQEDIRFARTISKIQRIIVTELTKIAIAHLYANGYENEDLVDFELELTNPSTVSEQQKLELLESKIDVAQKALDSGLYTKQFVWENILNLTEEDIELISKGQVDDAKTKHRLTQIEEEGNDPAETKRTFGDDGGSGDGGDDDDERELGFDFDEDDEELEDGSDDSLKDATNDLKQSAKPDKLDKRVTGYKPSLQAASKRPKMKRQAKILSEGNAEAAKYIQNIDNIVNGIKKKFDKLKTD